METVFVLSFSKKEFSGSGFALWRSLWLSSLSKEVFPFENGQIAVVHLPVCESELPFLGERTQKLLLRRLEEIIPKGAPTLSRESELLAPFVSIPDKEIKNRLGAQFLPEILTALYRQWGKKLTDGEVSIIKEEGDILPLVRALAPFVRSLSIISPTPDYDVGEKLIQEWGLAVSFRESVPKRCSLLFLWDGSLPEKIPKNTYVMSFWEEQASTISSEKLFFRAPQEIAPAMAHLGGITLSHLAVLEEGIPSISKAFRLSRITKFWC